MTLTLVSVTDTQAPPSSPSGLTPVACPSNTLVPGQSVTCTATYTVTQADLDNGSVTDSARRIGPAPDRFAGGLAAVDRDRVGPAPSGADGGEVGRAVVGVGAWARAWTTGSWSPTPAT